MIAFVRNLINGLVCSVVFMTTIFVGALAALLGMFVRAQMPDTTDLEPDEPSPPNASKQTVVSPVWSTQNHKRSLSAAFFDSN